MNGHGIRPAQREVIIHPIRLEKGQCVQTGGQTGRHVWHESPGSLSHLSEWARGERGALVPTTVSDSPSLLAARGHPMHYRGQEGSHAP